MVVLVFWGLAYSHCDLEQVPGLEFLSCCQHPDTAPHQDNDCQQDACSVVESGFYKVDEQQASAPIPFLAVSYLLPKTELAVSNHFAGIEAPSPVPPELPHGWQFLFRAALLPRAPSSVS